MTRTRFLNLALAAAAVPTLSLALSGAKADEPVNHINTTSMVCVATPQAVGGFKGKSIPITTLLFWAQNAQLVAWAQNPLTDPKKDHPVGFLSPDFFSAFGGEGKSPSAASSIRALMQAYFHVHKGAPEDDKTAQVPPAEPLKATGDGDPDTDTPPDENLREENILAAHVYATIRHYLTTVVFDRYYIRRFAVDPNGTQMGSADWGQMQLRQSPESPPEKADWFLWQIAAGQNYQIGCDDSGIAPPPHPTIAEAKPHPKKSGSTPWQSPIKTGSYHVSGERDDLALSSFALTDPLVTSPTFSIQPGSGSSGNSYNFTAQGAIGYNFFEQDCDYHDPTCTPMGAMIFADAFYGQDKNAPKIPGMTNLPINRIGAGLDLALRWNPFGNTTQVGADIPHRYGVLIQFIPEFITDTQFESKTYYTELRADIIDTPYQLCTGNSRYAQPFWGLQFSCGAALIMDAAHSFRSVQPVKLYTDYLRLGGEVGIGIEPDTGFCDDTFCKLVTNKLSVSAWYKLLADATQNHASIHNFTAQLSYNISGSAGSSGGKGLALTMQYTDGLEDITLYKLPTWSIGFKGSL